MTLIRRKDGTSIGFVEPSGKVTDRTGTPVGHVGKDRVLIDVDGTRRGWIDYEGTVRSARGERIGFVRRDGVVHDSSGEIIGSAEGTESERVGGAGVLLGLLPQQQVVQSVGVKAATSILEATPALPHRRATVGGGAGFDSPSSIQEALVWYIVGAGMLGLGSLLVYNSAPLSLFFFVGLIIACIGVFAMIPLTVMLLAVVIAVMVVIMILALILALLGC